MNISLIIPNFNGLKLLKKHLPYVFKAIHNKKNHIKEVIIVDDGSKDESVKFIKENYPKARVIKHTVNRGFSASINTGARSARYELLCILNNDVNPSINFLEGVEKFFKDEKLFAVSLREEGFTWAKARFEDGYLIHGPGEVTQKAHDTFWVSGGSGVFRRSLWMFLGGMDEKLFSPFYWEDLDISYRAMKYGYKLLWVPSAKVFHQHESTISKLPQSYVQRIRERNRLIFIWKNITSPALTKKHISALFKKVLRHPGYLRIVFMALQKYKVIKKERKRIKKESKVSDEAIFAKF